MGIVAAEARRLREMRAEVDLGKVAGRPATSWWQVAQSPSAGFATPSDPLGALSGAVAACWANGPWQLSQTTGTCFPACHGAYSVSWQRRQTLESAYDGVSAAHDRAFSAGWYPYSS